MGTVYYGRGFILNGFLILDIEYYNSDSSIFLTSSDNTSNSLIVWHARLGHIRQERMIELAREGFMGNLAKDTLSTCEYFLVGKSKRKPFGKATRACGLIELPPRLGLRTILGHLGQSLTHINPCIRLWVWSLDMAWEVVRHLRPPDFWAGLLYVLLDHI